MFQLEEVTVETNVTGPTHNEGHAPTPYAARGFGRVAWPAKSEDMFLMAQTCSRVPRNSTKKMLALSLLGGLSALLTQPLAGTAAASRGASRSGPVRCLIKGEVDEEAMLAASTFPIKPDELIGRAKQVLEAGVGTKDGGACLAPDFEFCAAVVGPLGRDEYLGALGNFKVRRTAAHAMQTTMVPRAQPPWRRSADPAPARNATLPWLEDAQP